MLSWEVCLKGPAAECETQPDGDRLVQFLSWHVDCCVSALLNEKSCPVTVRRKCNADWATAWYLSGESPEVLGL